MVRDWFELVNGGAEFGNCKEHVLCQGFLGPAFDFQRWPLPFLSP